MQDEITLNKIAADIADPLGKSYDVMFIERIKFEVLYWRAELLRRDGDRNQLSKEFIQPFVTNLQRVDKADTCFATVGCDVLRTVSPIPKPIRPKDFDSLFKFVGSVDGDTVYTYTDLEMLKHTKHNRFTSNVVRYNYTNGYIYVFNNNKLKYVRVEGIFVDPRLAKIKCDGKPCFNDDTAFPIGADMLRTIVEGIRTGALKAPIQEDQEVQIEASDNSGGATTGRGRTRRS